MASLLGVLAMLVAIVRQALDAAAYSVAGAHEAHDHYHLAPPTGWEACGYWLRGLLGGLCRGVACARAGEFKEKF